MDINRGPTVAIGVCTANRTEQLGVLLDHLLRQSVVAEDPDRFTLIVVDNSRDATAHPVVGEKLHECPFAVKYRHEPEPGLSVARNSVMEEAAAVPCELLAFIDDDEMPEPWWLGRLLQCREDTGADIVTGPVDPLLPPGAPDWLVQGRFLYLDSFPDGARLKEAISGNALLHLPSIAAAGLTFDRRFDRTGGEDQLFFRQAVASGLRINYAAGATVYESVPPTRTTFSFLLRRELRKGNTLGLLAKEFPDLGEGRLFRLSAAARWTVVGLLVMMKGLVGVSGVQFRSGVLRMARACGMIGGVFGWRYLAY